MERKLFYMNSITITESGRGDCNLMYIQTAMNELFQHADCVVKRQTFDGRVVLKVDCVEYYFDIIKTEIADKIAEIIAIKYKYDFFKKNLSIGGLSSEEREILLASLISADLEDDKKYTIEKTRK